MRHRVRAHERERHRRGSARSRGYSTGSTSGRECRSGRTLRCRLRAQRRCPIRRTRRCCSGPEPSSIGAVPGRTPWPGFPRTHSSTPARAGRSIRRSASVWQCHGRSARSLRISFFLSGAEAADRFRASYCSIDGSSTRPGQRARHNGSLAAPAVASQFARQERARRPGCGPTYRISPFRGFRHATSCPRPRSCASRWCRP